MGMRMIWMGAILTFSTFASGQQVTVSARVAMQEKRSHARTENAVLWLTPVGTALPVGANSPNAQPLRLTQEDKRFSPHVLVVPVGALVEFPNKDPFFHNVFSLFEGKRFDLGLYEAGTTRNVRFSKPGISYIFCNIHAEMSAVVIALETPYYGIANRRGEVVIPNVPLGRYTIRIWDELATPGTLNAMAHEVTVSESTSSLGLFSPLEPKALHPHKNKYGRDYDPPAPDSPAYVHP